MKKAFPTIIFFISSCIASQSGHNNYWDIFEQNTVQTAQPTEVEIVYDFKLLPSPKLQQKLFEVGYQFFIDENTKKAYEKLQNFFKSPESSSKQEETLFIKNSKQGLHCSYQEFPQDLKLIITGIEYQFIENFNDRIEQLVKSLVQYFKEKEQNKTTNQMTKPHQFKLTTDGSIPPVDEILSIAKIQKGKIEKSLKLEWFKANYGSGKEFLNLLQQKGFSKIISENEFFELINQIVQTENIHTYIK